MEKEGADMIAHPGLISRDDVMTAKKKGVVLEITSRKGHSISNGYVAKTAAEIGADLIINTDSHSPEDLITVDLARIVLRSAGIPEGAIGKIFENSKKLAKKICKESRR
ncbi:MAG: hypothetical protein L0958_04725 [Candidatus Mariimomonas ferrooxydans]